MTRSAGSLRTLRACDGLRRIGAAASRATRSMGSCCRLNPRPRLSGRLGQTWDYPVRGPLEERAQ
jgi:hypothetical protein